MDASNDAILYASGNEGLYRTTDGGQSWQLSFPSPDPASTSDQIDGTPVIEAVAISRADPSVAYISLRSPYPSAFLRSQDAGTTWKYTEFIGRSMYRHRDSLLYPHPTDVNRLYRAKFWSGGGSSHGVLVESLDQGVHTDRKESADWNRRGDQGDPADRAYMVGGEGKLPGRFFFSTGVDDRYTGSYLTRSDDDGKTWIPMPGFPESMTGHKADGTAIQISGLAFDPNRPDTIYVSILAIRPESPARTGIGVIFSLDAGATWASLGRRDIGAVRDLAFGVNGQSLYAATDLGVFRFRL